MANINSFMNKLEQLAFNVEQKDGLFPVQIFAVMLQIWFLLYVCSENCR